MSQPSIAEQDGSNLFVRIVHTISRICGIVSAGMIVVAVFVTCQLIFVRFVLNESTIWQTEAVTYLMIAATLIGLPYVQLLRGHVNVDLLPILLPPPARKALTVLIIVTTLAVAGVMFLYGFTFFHEAYERNWRSGTVWNARLWIPYVALPLGFGLYGLQLLADLVSPKPVIAVQEREDAGQDAALATAPEPR